MAVEELPDLRRLNHGRGHSYSIDGRKVPGITTVLGLGYPKPALVNWAADETASYAVDNWDELVELKPSERLKLLKGARFESQREAKVRGTRVHDLAHRLAGGDEVEVPEQYVGHVDSYLKFAMDWEPRELMVERPVFSTRYGYAGTPDLVAGLADGKVWLLDWKTGAKGGVYLDHVLQLAAARYAEWALVVDGKPVPMVGIDHCGIVWIREDGYDLYPVEADEQAFAMFLYVKQVARFVDGDRDEWVGDALLPPGRTS